MKKEVEEKEMLPCYVHGPDALERAWHAGEISLLRLDRDIEAGV